jgi:RNA polymerase sigma-70 factor, ECF subfamily
MYCAIALPVFSSQAIALRWPFSALRNALRHGAMTVESAPPTPAEWAALLGAVANTRDRQAFAQLFEHFSPRLKAYMRRSGASDAQAEELAQETMLAVWRKAELFNPASAGASTWIFTIARNLRIDALRRERRMDASPQSDVELEYLIDATPLPETTVAGAQNEELMRGALAKLPRDQVRVVELSFFEEKAHAEIARILQIPLGTVKSRLRLAMRQLRNLLGDAI